jgi:regulatory protein
MIEPAILYYCKYQERCHKEVRNKLYELGFSTITVDDQISELIAADILNEERFAKSYARGKWRILHWGRNKIKQQLKLKNVSDYCIKKALQEIPEDDYQCKLEELTIKKWGELRTERSKQMKKAKVYRYLLQKGYEQDLILSCIAACVST